ncbi:PE domain-containing protein [Saccharopolyspora spinosa]|uniref:PE family protein n=1 Tax=Saccharopolyspora spinosa TaxID=60894 RepID=A0A2N3XTR3_SACSN|nr:PE domain-containing protein [Saccharopolyspora spinosa]PKW14032.1 PE family protein [Saccharopolyspora spinosa]
MSFFDGVGNAVVTAGQKVARSATIHTAINSGGTAKAASFQVDIEQIPGLITEYEKAQDMLGRILRKAQDLQNVVPPGDDEVSERLASSLGEMAGNNEGCLSWAVNDARARIQSQIDQLKAALGTYQTTDENATARQV